MNDATPSTEGRTRWSAVFAFGLATLVVASESSLVGFALPLVSTEFGVDSGTTAWVVLAYALPLAALAIPAGRWVDTADVRTVFAASLATLAAASLLAGLAPSFWALVVGRGLQGVASALYLAVYLPVVAGAVREEQRGRAMGYIQAVMMIGSIALAPVGGMIAAEFGWRAVFLFKLPLLALVLWWGHRAIPPRQLTGPRLPTPGLPLLKDALLLGGAVALGLLAMEQFQDTWAIASGLAIAATASALLWLRLPSARPVVALIRRPAFGSAAAALSLIATTSGLVVFTLPFFVSDVMGESPELLGAGLVFFVGAAALLSPVAGTLADRFGAFPTATTGAALTTAALPAMLSLGADTGLADLAWRMTLLGAAMALFNSPALTALLGAAPRGEEGAASGVTNLARTLGNTVGPAIAALTWGLANGGQTGFRASVLAMTACTALALVALLAARYHGTGDRRAPAHPG